MMKTAVNMPREKSQRTPVLTAPLEKSRKPAVLTPKRKPSRQPPELTNIVKTAIRIIAGAEPGEVARAARIIGISEPTLYRWRRAGNLLDARGVEVLRVHELTGLPVELLLRG
jgi:transcriptional regulator of acetoin/glycerol metabolism